MANGDIPPGAVRVTVETLGKDKTTVTSTTTINIPCDHVAPDTVRDKVVDAVEHIKKEYEHP
jgi:hypothetical protein